MLHPPFDWLKLGKKLICPRCCDHIQHFEELYGVDTEPCLHK